MQLIRPTRLIHTLRQALQAETLTPTGFSEVGSKNRRDRRQIDFSWILEKIFSFFIDNKVDPSVWVIYY